MSIKIGEHILKVLSDDTNVARAVGDRIYPVVYAKGEDVAAKFPYIIYQRTASDFSYTKDAGDTQRVNAQIFVVAKTYSAMLNLCEDVCDALTVNDTGTYGGYEVNETELNVSGDDWDADEGAYYTIVNATFTTQNLYKD